MTYHGLRSHGLQKKSQVDLPLISVITVVFNNAESIEKTILSVVEQTYTNIEFIVIDGGSSDGTVEIIKRFDSKIDFWASEKDKGIYDAMNKGLSAASGDWLIFLNSGDVFVDRSVIETVFLARPFKAKIVYGNYIADYGQFKKRYVARDLQTLWRGMCFSHQSVFIDRSYHLENKYDTNYKYAADFDFFLKAYIDKEGFFYVNTDIAEISIGGASDSNRIAVFKENSSISLKRSNGSAALRIKCNLFFIYVVVTFLMKNVLKRLLPAGLRNFIMKVK